MRNKLRACIAGFLAVTFVHSVQGQTILHVDDSAAGAGDGSSWVDAFPSLSLALDVAELIPGSKVIRVAEGVYRPDVAGLIDPRDATFELQHDVEILGGFAGNAADPEERDVTGFPTILSGDIGIDGNETDNCYHVVTAFTDPESAVLDGFRIREGFADAAFPDNCGAGILISAESRAVIRNCIIRRNTATEGGGGVRIINSSPTFESCTFVLNEAVAGGGAYVISVSDGFSEPIFRNCIFDRNTATGSNGGGIRMSNSTMKIVGCRFAGNSAGYSGGGFSADGGVVEAVNCGFFGNSALVNAGGGVYVSQGELSLVNGVFSGNEAAIIGGGVAAQLDSVVAIANCSIANNAAVVAGGGMYADHVTLNLLNTISYYNTAGGDSDEPAQVYLGLDVVLAFDRNCVQGLTGTLGGVGNIGDEPGFVDPDGPDDSIGTADDHLGLGSNSPCIDAGTNAAVSSDVGDIDLDGDTAELLPLDHKLDPRIQDETNVADTGDGASAIVDMGAFEVNADCDASGLADVDEIRLDGSLDCDGNSVLDSCEPDSDGDGRIDACDNCPDVTNVSQQDADGDGIGDACAPPPEDNDEEEEPESEEELDEVDEIDEGADESSPEVVMTIEGNEQTATEEGAPADGADVSEFVTPAAAPCGLCGPGAAPVSLACLALSMTRIRRRRRSCRRSTRRARRLILRPWTAPGEPSSVSP